MVGSRPQALIRSLATAIATCCLAITGLALPGPASAITQVPVLTTSPATLYATKGQPFSGPVGGFTETPATNPASAFAVTIKWGDGKNSTATVVGAGGSFTVSGSHTYSTGGPMTVQAVVQGPGTEATTVVSSMSVFVQGTNSFSVTESSKYAGAVATFTPVNPADLGSDYAATIDWGDGTEQSAIVSGPPGGPMTVSSSGGHTYNEEGTFAVHSTVSRDGGAPFPLVTTGHVAEVDSLSGEAVVNFSQEPGTNFSGVLAAFADTWTDNVPSGFTATINWGDGTTAAGTISELSPGHFNVSGSHTWTAAAVRTVSVTFRDTAPGTASSTVSTKVYVGHIFAGHPSASAIEGVTFNNKVVGFTDSNLLDTAGDLTATINWGDGTTTPGTILAGSAPGAFSIDGLHAWAEEGSFPLTVVVNGPASSHNTLTGTAAVVDADHFTPKSLGSIAPKAGSTFAGVVASFTDPVPIVAANLAVSIQWGDGTTTGGSIVVNGTTITVSGAHTWFEPGTYSLHVVLSEKSPGTATGTALPKATVGGVTAGVAFVDAAYTDFLARPPTSGELSTWAAGIDAGTTPRSNLVGALSTSDEWVKAVVNQLYHDTLGRSGDAGGLTYWSNQIRSGQVTVAQAAASFYGSPEYFNGIGGGTNASWLGDLYQKLLGRTIDSGGLSYWEGQVASTGRTSVALRLYNSSESCHVRVSRLFVKLLGRTPDTAGGDYWAGRVATDGDLALAANLAASDEYYHRARTRFP